MSRSNLVPYYRMIPGGKMLSSYACTRSYVNPSGYEYAIITITMESFDALMNQIGKNPNKIKEWVAYWYGGSPEEEAKFPKPHPSELDAIRIGTNKGIQEDMCEIQVTSQRGHYMLAKDITLIGVLNKESIPLWPK